MPAAVQVKVVAARDLPIMDRSSELTDAFVEVKLGPEVYRTEVCPKTLNPIWDSQWFKFNVNDEVFQDEPLQIKLMDYDVYSAHDAIGRVYISLSNMVVEGSPTHIQGWFPIFDTLHGVRGEVNVRVQVDLIVDQYHLSQSSCQVQFFSSLEVPCRFTTVALLGFVEELVVNDDPEYQWIDKIRTPRASNEVRQSLFLKLSGELQRRIGVKALALGGNVVLGYHQFFDLEGETGIVVRGFGTCTLVKYPAAVEEQVSVVAQTISEDRPSSTEPLKSPLERAKKPSMSDADQPPPPAPQSKADASCLTPQCSEHGLGTASMSAMTDGPGVGVSASAPALKPGFSSEWLPFYTLTSLPVGTLKHIGGLVSAKSVKLLDKINNPDEPETRDAWWQEIRSEVRSHARCMGCNAVIGYMESTSICDTLCVLSALGTAVSVDPQVGGGGGGDDSVVDSAKRLSALNSSLEMNTERAGEVPTSSSSTSAVKEADSFDDNIHCSVCHAPYIAVKPPFEYKLSQCAVCHQKPVPSVILSTGDLPAGLLVRGKGCLLQVVVCHSKRRMRGDDNATHVGKELPFIEYSLHLRLMNKLALKKMNAIFGLKIQIAVGETMIVGVATGTAVFLEALPPPRSNHKAKDCTSCGDSVQPTATSKPQEEGKRRLISESSFDMGGMGSPIEPNEAPVISEDHHDEVDFAAGPRRDQAAVVVVEARVDEQDGCFDMQQDTLWPDGFYVSTTSTVPGVALCTLSNDTKLITVVDKKAITELESMIPLETILKQFFLKTLKSLVFRVRRMHPCVLSDIQFEVDLPEENEIQVTVTAMATSLKEGSQANAPRVQSEEVSPDDSRFLTDSSPYLHDINDATNISHIYMTTLPVVPGYQITRYLGMINLFLIRESTSVREVGNKIFFQSENVIVMTPRVVVYCGRDSTPMKEGIFHEALIGCDVCPASVRVATSLSREGGLDAFMRVFILQAHSIARAHVSAMGGNALLSYKMNKCVLIEHCQQNKAQCLLHLGGDSVELKRMEATSSRTGSLNGEDTHLENMEPVGLPGTQSSQTRSASTMRNGTEVNNCAAPEDGSGEQTATLTRQVTSV